MTSRLSFIPRILALAAALPTVGCAGLLGPAGPSAAEQFAAPEQCFRSYTEPAGPPNPNATSAILAWYATLTPAIVEKLADGATHDEFAERVMKHAAAAGVPEGDFLSGQHPEPSRACGMFWSHEDVGNQRYDNAASVAESVFRRDAFAKCSARFDTLWPKLSTAAAEATRAIGALGPDADVYQVWSTYHQVMAAQAQAIPVGDGDPPTFAYTGAPHIVFTDLMQRFPGSPNWFLADHWLGGVSPLPRDAARMVQPLPASADEARLAYCALSLYPLGRIYTGLREEDVDKLAPRFDGVAWLESLPGSPSTTTQLTADDFIVGRMLDRASGQTDDDEAFRLYARPVSAVKLAGGRGKIELTTVEEKHYNFDCKRVVKVKQESADTSSITHEEKCKVDDRTETNALTLTVAALPPGVTIAVGDQLIFYARRTAADHQDGTKPTKHGAVSFSTDTAAAELVFLAAVRRGGDVLFPSPAYRP